LIILKFGHLLWNSISNITTIGIYGIMFVERERERYFPFMEIVKLRLQSLVFSFSLTLGNPSRETREKT